MYDENLINHFQASEDYLGAALIGFIIGAM